VLFGGSFFLTLYAAFGTVWWGPEEFTLGSWGTVHAVLQILVDALFDNVVIGVLYVIGVSVVLSLVAHFTLTPLDPDVAAIQSELNNTKDEADKLRRDVQSLEGENKQLQVFLSEKEDALTAIQGELESVRSTTTTPPPEDIIPPEVDQDLLASISDKDEQIQLLENRIIELENRLQSVSEVTEAPPMIPPDVTEKQKLFEEFTRRAETATQVADSVVSDTTEVISMVQSSTLDESVKLALIKLVESLGKSLTKVAGSPEIEKQEPKVEMIGAVMMLHELVDAIKKMSRS
jgi:hypothetical protein